MINDKSAEHQKLWRRLRKAILQSTATLLVLSLLTNLAMLAVPIYSLQIFDRVMSSQSEGTLWMLCIAASIVCAAMVGFDSLRRKVPRMISQFIGEKLSAISIQCGLDQNEHHSAQQQDSQEPDGFKFTPSTLLTLQQQLNHPVVLSLADALFSPLFLLVLFIIHPYFAVLMLISNLLCFLMIALKQHGMAHQQEKLKAAQKLSQQQLHNLQQQYPATQAMGSSNVWQQHSNDALLARIATESTVENRQQRFASWCNSLRLITQLAIPTLGALLLIEQLISPGMLLAAIIIGLRALMPYELIINQWHTLSRIKDILTGIKETLLSPQESQKQRPIAELEGNISLQGPATIEHRALNISIKAGSAIAIIGPIGSGKSNLFRLLMGMPTEAPTNELTAHLDQHNAQLLERDWLQGQLGFAGKAEQPLELSIRDFISVCTANSDDLIQQAATQAGVHEDITALPLGYDTVISQNAMARSQGFMQKLAIARALFGQPKYLFLDDVDALLDKQSLDALQYLLTSLKKRGTTVVYSSQRKSLLNQADQVLLMEQGRPIFFGSQDQLKWHANKSMNSDNAQSTGSACA